jgi:hypothetical protein
MFTCYLDESGTDSNSPTAVVGGLILNCSGFFWLDIEWTKAATFHRVTLPIHMREFTPHGRFASMNSEARRALFADLVSIVNEYKLISIGAVLDAEQYRSIFSGVTKMSMYGACFAQATMTNDILAKCSTIGYVLDSGNRFKKDIVEAHASFRSRGVNLGNLEFGSDDSNCALQAADMISWTVRRCISSTLPKGFEPLSDVFDQHHTEVPYKAEWMELVADALRAQAGSSSSGGISNTLGSADT